MTKTPTASLRLHRLRAVSFVYYTPTFRTTTDPLLRIKVPPPRTDRVFTCTIPDQRPQPFHQLFLNLIELELSVMEYTFETNSIRRLATVLKSFLTKKNSTRCQYRSVYMETGNSLLFTWNFEINNLVFLCLLGAGSVGACEWVENIRSTTAGATFLRWVTGSSLSDWQPPLL